MSWPIEGVVESPNDADIDALLISFMRLSHLCSAVAILIIAGLMLRFWKGDLSKAYKRTGQQRSTQWRRTTYGVKRSQTLDVICFGQRDGPEIFTRQTSFMVYIIESELEYADACYPPFVDGVIAYMYARKSAAENLGMTPTQIRVWMRLFWIMAMIDDFGAVSINDPLKRIDGSVVCELDGSWKHRATLHFDVFQSVVTRLGHKLDPTDPQKYTSPASAMVLLGGWLDLKTETLALDDAKRVSYGLLLRLFIGLGILRPSQLTSLAFKMLVVCEVRPSARQWLHPLFRALRNNRTSSIILSEEPAVAESINSFSKLLDSDEKIAIPFACRESFPFANQSDLLVIFADASGAAPTYLPQNNTDDGLPGYGAWTVRGTKLYIIEGVWTKIETDNLSISVLEYLITFWAEVVFSLLFPAASHILEFTDNTGTEWSARREAPSAKNMQSVTARRSEFLRANRIFARTCRVTSENNTWADDLSRQRLLKVRAEAAALGLSVHIVEVPPHVRNTAWVFT